MKIICIGRNYADHAKEMNSPLPEQPIIFLKPDTAVLKGDFYYPEFTKDIHYECEVVFRVGTEGKYISKAFAMRHIESVGIGIDFTARDLQLELKDKGLPWELSKAFNGSAAVSEMQPLDKYADINNLSFEFKQNGEVKQRGKTSDMIFQLDTIVAFVSQYFTLKTGDLIFTGTPVGVGSIQIGDKLECFLEGERLLECKVK